jgi:(-)-alpha-terpineol synthase
LNCQGESFAGRIDKLKEEVRMMFHKVVDPLEKLELIDILQRLGLSYHFDDEIRRTLEGIYNANHGGEMCNMENIYTTALEFRLLRQHGYSVPQGKQLNYSNPSIKISNTGEV